MRAAVLERVGSPMEITDLDVADVAADEVLVRTLASGVCHSDYHVYLGRSPLELPRVLGHEAAGVVERVGDAVSDVRPGDLVVTCPSAFCGSCEWCVRGHPNMCLRKGHVRPDGAPPRLSQDGRPVAAMAGLGSFAEQMLVSERSVVPVDPAVPPDLAALLGCAVLTGMGSVFHAAKVRPGQTVAVIGCGGVGVNAIQAARLAGASRVIAVDLVAAKLDFAVRFGATDTVDASEADPVAAVIELTAGGVDHALEVVGSPVTIEQAFSMLRPRGTATVVGVSRPSDRISISPLALLGERRLQGTNMGSNRFRLDVPLYARMYLDGRVKLDELIVSRTSLRDVNETLTGIDELGGPRSVITFAA